MPSTRACRLTVLEVKDLQTSGNCLNALYAGLPTHGARNIGSALMATIVSQCPLRGPADSRLRRRHRRRARDHFGLNALYAGLPTHGCKPRSVRKGEREKSLNALYAGLPTHGAYPNSRPIPTTYTPGFADPLLAPRHAAQLAAPRRPADPKIRNVFKILHKSLIPPPGKPSSGSALAVIVIELPRTRPIRSCRPDRT